MISVLITILLFCLIDLFYVNILKPHYFDLITRIQGGRKPELNYTSAFLSYIFLIVGLVFIAIPRVKSVQNTRVTRSLFDHFKLALTTGGVVGFVIYGVYNTTNVALLKDYSLTLAFVDTIWGTLLFTISTFVYILLSTSK